MDYTEVIQQIRERFEKRIEKDAYLSKVQQKIEKGTATMVDADIYASKLAECYRISIGEVLGKSSIEEYKEAVDVVLPRGFYQITNRINDCTMEIIDQQLRDAEIGMKAVPAEYDHRKERKVVEEIRKVAERADEVSQVEPVASKQIESFAQNAAVNTIRKNAEAQSNAGIEALVTRRYDGIGIHSRKDPCEWCLERCGENMHYSEAYAKGAFERHPGCHCEIFYKPKKGSWQRQNDWKNNAWKDSQDPQTLKMRQKYGTDSDSLSASERISKIPQINNVTAEYLKDATPKIGKIIQEPGYTNIGHEEEKLFAQWLRNVLGGDILQNKDSQTKGLHYADYTWRKGLWELKTVSSSKYNTFDQHVRKAEKQISANRGGYLFDITKGVLSIDDAMVLIGRSMKERKIQRTDVLIRKGNDFRVLRIG